MRARIIAVVAAALLITTVFASAAAAGDTITVCPAGPPTCDHASIQGAVDAASPGDTIDVGPGTYQEAVEVSTPDIVIQGAGQNVTTLDGDADGNKIFDYGIQVTADGVTVRDLTVRDYGGDGVYFADVIGFYVERVTALNNQVYGIYAIRSEVGWIRDSYAWGHPDSGFYIGEVVACECVIENVKAAGNLIGYSGTGASHVTIRGSVFQDNAAGIVPNVLPNEPTPQTNLVVVDNVVRNNNNETASEKWHFSNGVHVPAGLGVVLAGGVSDLVTENVIVDHERAGVAIVWLFTEPTDNRVIDNVIDNGPAQDTDAPGEVFEDDPVDVLWDGGGANNCFEDNQRVNGDAITFDAGPVWNTAGTLPDCSTPNAGPPSPTGLAREVSLLLFHCEPGEHLTDDGHVTSPEACHQHAA